MEKDNYADNMRATQPRAIDELAKANKLRALYRQKLSNGDITFDQLLEMSLDDSLKPLRKMKIIGLLSNSPGWTIKSARYAFVANGLSESLRLSGCHDQRRRTIVSSLIDSSSAKWQSRLPAPQGWPWFGNIATVLEDIDAGSLPRELREVRFRFGEEPEDKPDYVPLTPENASAQISIALGGDDPDQTDESKSDDNPGANTGDYANSDDFLDSLFDDDTDDEEEDEDITEENTEKDDDELSEDDINRMLGF